MLSVFDSAKKTRIRAWLTSICVLAPAVSHAQSDWKLELFSDSQLSSCAVNFTGPGLFQIHIVHTGSGESFVVGFALYPPACMTGFWAGDRFDTQNLILGSSQDNAGVGISYRGCVALPVYLGYVQFYATTPSEACCEFRASDPSSVASRLEGGNCEDFTAVPIESGRVILNPTPNCPCESPVAVQSTTWGGIKALYR